MDADVAARFWSKVDTSDDLDACWRWKGARLKTGYGAVKVGGVSKRAHRVAFELSGGTIPTGMMVLHSCDTPLCCNPAHLRVGTAAENTADARERGRVPTAAPRPAPTRTHRRREPQPSATKDGAEPAPDDLLSTAEAGEVMGVSDAHVRRVIGTGELKATRFGERAWMVRRVDAEAWASVQRRTGPKGGHRLILTYDDVRQWRQMGESLHPSIPAAALQLANQMLDVGATGEVTAGADCRIEIDAERVTFWLPTATPRRTKRIEF